MNAMRGGVKHFSKAASHDTLPAVDYLCLAAGRGTRLGHLGRYLQKCMYPVGTRPFLEYSLRSLLDSKLARPEEDRLTLVVGHEERQVRRYFGRSYHGLTLRYVRQGRALGTGHAVYRAWRAMRFRSPVVIWLADLYVSSRLFDQIREHQADNVLTLYASRSDEHNHATVEVSGGVVRNAWHARSGLYDIGLWKLSPGVMRGMTAVHDDEYRVLQNLQRVIDGGTRVEWVPCSEWIHLGGAKPSVERNVQAVVRRLWELWEDGQ